MKPDCELLRQYAEKGDDAAFTEVVRRHLSLVYASAVRQLNGNATMAQDVTQIVFTDLARKAGALIRHTSVAGWLHTSVRFAAANAVRAEQRRRLREQEASAMSDQINVLESTWVQLQPLIDEAVGQLRGAERDAVLLRFFEEKSHREVGVALGLTENAARMRVERGLEKLRAHFGRHGITASVALLTAALNAHAASAPAPVALAATVATKALFGAGLPAGGAGLAKAGLSTFWGTKAQLALAGSTAFASIAAATLIFIQPGSGASLAPRPSLAAPPPAPLIAPASVIAEVQAKMPNAPDAIAVASAVATTTTATMATTTAATGSQLVQSLPQATKSLAGKNPDNQPADAAPDSGNAAPIADDATPASADDPDPAPQSDQTAPTVAATSPAATSAPDYNQKITRWAPATGGNGHYYLAVAAPGGISWAAAQRYAAQRGGHLATIATKEENDFVFSLVNAPEFWQLTPNKKALLGPWLGGMRSGHSFDMAYGWEWISDGSMMTFTNWALLEPRTNGNRLHFFAWGDNRVPTWDNDPAQVLLPGFVAEFNTFPHVSASLPLSPANQPVVAQNQPSTGLRGTVPGLSVNQRQVILRPAGPQPAPQTGQRGFGPIIANKDSPLAMVGPGFRATP